MQEYTGVWLLLMKKLLVVQVASVNYEPTFLNALRELFQTSMLLCFAAHALIIHHQLFKELVGEKGLEPLSMSLHILGGFIMLRLTILCHPILY